MSVVTLRRARYVEFARKIDTCHAGCLIPAFVVWKQPDAVHLEASRISAPARHMLELGLGVDQAPQVAARQGSCGVSPHWVGKRPCLLQRIHVLPKPSTTAPIVV